MTIHPLRQKNIRYIPHRHVPPEILHRTRSSQFVHPADLAVSALPHLVRGVDLAVDLVYNNFKKEKVISGKCLYEN